MSEIQKQSRSAAWFRGITRVGRLAVGFTGYVVTVMAVAMYGIWLVTSGRADMANAAFIITVLNAFIHAWAMIVCG